jgi:hypothetical protein
MDQGFDCFCGSKNCLGYIGGAKYMTSAQLEGRWINAHIRSLLEERESERPEQHEMEPDDSYAPINSPNQSKINEAEIPTRDPGELHTPDKDTPDTDPTHKALLFMLSQARTMVDTAQKALETYMSLHSDNFEGVNGVKVDGTMRRGVTSREMSGEMGGDTFSA